MRRSLRFKLLGVVAVVLAGMTMAAALCVIATTGAQGDVSSLDGISMPATRLVGDLHLGVAEFNRDQLAYLAASDATGEAAAKAAMTQHQGEVADAFAGLAALSLTPTEHALYVTAQADWRAYLAATANLTTAV